MEELAAMIIAAITKADGLAAWDVGASLNRALIQLTGVGCAPAGLAATQIDEPD